MPRQFETLEDVKAWAHYHDGQITAWWHEQHTLNANNEKRFREIENRVSAIEKRVIWASGVAAGIGAVVGSFLN